MFFDLFHEIFGCLADTYDKMILQLPNSTLLFKMWKNEIFVLEEAGLMCFVKRRRLVANSR